MPHALATASLLALLPCVGTAQSTEQVTIIGRTLPAPASVSGFGDVPAARSPFQASTVNQSALQDLGVDTLNEVTRLDAGINDAYNAPGYWASVAVRGFALDNRYNFRRDGLPISGETALPLYNKERVEIFKGISGIQAGTSAPAGLVNLVVKRPRGTDSTTVLVGASDGGNVQVAADIERRLADGAAGLRINASAEHLDPQLRDSQGSRYSLALAGMGRLGASSQLDADLELSRQSQPSAPGFSLLGATLPAAGSIDPKTNLNNQPWSQPVVFAGTTASLRWTERLQADWQAVAQLMSQRLRTDDRLAFPYGCDAEGRYDRYCSDGSFDLYDFRSEGERRTTDSASLRLVGSALTGSLTHHLSLGLLASQFKQRMGLQTYNYAGVGTIDGRTVVAAAPGGYDGNTNRDERSVEWSATDRIELAEFGLWLGLRHTALRRQSAVTDGSNATDYRQGLTTPWLAGTWQLNREDMVYLSWGQGVESSVVPNLPVYSNAGQALPALKSRQTELGVKHDGKTLGWSLTAFDIHRPTSADFGSCDVDDSCTQSLDGEAHHQGLEAAADWRHGAWALRGSASLMRARREGSATASINGLVPTNVPQRSLRLGATYQVAELPGLQVGAQLSAEGARYVLPDNSLSIPSWTTVGLNARYATRALGHDWLWRAGVDNVFNRRAWQESPYQYSHVYLYPVAARTFRISLQANL